MMSHLLHICPSQGEGSLIVALPQVTSFSLQVIFLGDVFPDPV